MTSRAGDTNVLVYEHAAREHSDKEIAEYAEFLGIDLVLEPHLMWIAREGVAAPILPPWKACHEDGNEEVFYFNFETSESVWDHPCDDKYRTLAEDERRKHNEKLSGSHKSSGARRSVIAQVAIPRTFSAGSAFTDVSEGRVKSVKEEDRAVDHAYGDAAKNASSSSSDKGVEQDISTSLDAGQVEEKRLAETVRDKEKQHGERHPEVATAFLQLASHQGMYGRPELQKESLANALKIQETHYGEDHAILADTLTSLAVAHSALGNSAEERLCFLCHFLPRGCSFFERRIHA